MSTVIEHYQAALVADPEHETLDIYLPECDDNADVPELFVLLCACAARAHAEPYWAEEMIDWFMNQRNIKH